MYLLTFKVNSISQHKSLSHITSCNMIIEIGLLQIFMSIILEKYYLVILQLLDKPIFKYFITF